MMKPLLLTAAAAVLALATGAATTQPAQKSLAPSENGENWSAKVERTARGHAIGKPDADAKLIEFISYTCPHCADFTARGEPPLDIVLLQPGKVTLEVRPVIRNGIDLAVTLLANCGDPAGFKGRHQALMLNQAVWLGKARNAPQSQLEIWQRADKAARMNAVNALGLTELLAQRGQSRAELDACVSNDTAAKALLANDEADAAEFGISSTPSFALDGKLLADVHGWETLYPVLSARFAPKAD
ncbi:MAG: thioredoxin domain-containing protein [Erythrobacter sp.]